MNSFNQNDIQAFFEDVFYLKGDAYIGQMLWDLVELKKEIYRYGMNAKLPDKNDYVYNVIRKVVQLVQNGLLDTYIENQIDFAIIMNAKNMPANHIMALQILKQVYKDVVGDGSELLYYYCSNYCDLELRRHIMDYLWPEHMVKVIHDEYETSIGIMPSLECKYYQKYGDGKPMCAYVKFNKEPLSFYVEGEHLSPNKVYLFEDEHKVDKYYWEGGSWHKSFISHGAATVFVKINTKMVNLLLKGAEWICDSNAVSVETVKGRAYKTYKRNIGGEEYVHSIVRSRTRKDYKELARNIEAVVNCYFDISTNALKYICFDASMASFQFFKNLEGMSSTIADPHGSFANDEVFNVLHEIEIMSIGDSNPVVLPDEITKGGFTIEPKFG